MSYEMCDEVNKDERVTDWLHPEKDNFFIIMVVNDIVKVNATPYLIEHNNKIAVCREGWIPCTSYDN